MATTDENVPLAVALGTAEGFASSLPPRPPVDATFPYGMLNEGGAREFLSMYRWPVPIQYAFLQHIRKISVRIFVLDDSGSMGLSDGSRLVMANGQPRMINCSRWAELGDAMRFHVGLAQAGGIPSEFRLLNGAPPIRIGFDANHPPDKAQTLLHLFDESPGGGTPLCRHIREIVHQMEEWAPTLRASGQRVCIVIATDGEASDGQMEEALVPLANLPCWVVLRLCTDEEPIVKYWNEIDAQLELDMDVIDDLSGEAIEIHRHNPWLGYGESLQRLREFGVHLKELDLLDEGPLSLEQVRRLCFLCFGRSAVESLPLPEVDLDSFLAGIQQLQQSEGQPREVYRAWSPVSKRYQPWIDTVKLKKIHGRKSHHSCNIS